MKSVRVGTSPSTYRVLLLGATVLGLLASAQHFAVMQMDAVDPSWRTVRHALSKEMPWWYLWVAAAPLAIRANRLVPLLQRRLFVAIPFHLVLALAMILVHSALLLAAHRILGFPTGRRPFWPTYLGNVPFSLTTGLLGYGLMFGTVLAVDYYRRYRDSELKQATLGRELAEARLQALRMQLNPHFLFNAMNTISMLVRRRENTAAVKMVAGLSDLLRSVLEEAPPQEVPLQRELKFIERYLELERTRFADRLRQDVRIDPDTLEALVPNLILQPLVENAVKHGVALRPAGGTVTITARRAGDRVVLTVQDDGVGLRDACPDAVTPATGIPVSRSGIGLANIQARLDELYGERARLELESRPDGFVATVTLPYRTGTSAAGAAA
jgi:signal transduction histidine kinase